LAAVALPAYQDYTTRAKMSEVVGFAAAAKTSVSECLISENSVGSCDSNTEVGLAAASSITSTYVESVTIGQTGGNATITVAIQGTNNTTLDAATLIYTGALGGTGVTWTCAGSATTINQWLPPECR
jgi:type IV pilus assembly protein PilA